MVVTGLIPGAEWDPGWLLIAVAAVCVAGLIVSVVTARRAAARNAGLRLEAARRGFSYLPDLDRPGLPGLLFRSGSDVRAFDLLDARMTSTPFLAGSVTGRYADDSFLLRAVAASFVAIPLDREVPNIVLVGSGFGVMRQAGIALPGRQRLSLEGDFDSSFTLYCPTGYERDALYIFAPDLMQLLVDTTAGCDVELVDRWMFVYSAPGRYRDPAAIPGLVRVTANVQEKLRRQTTRYRDDRSAPLATAGDPTSRTISPEEHAARAGLVAVGGRRVRTRMTVLQKTATVAATAILIYAVAYFVITSVPGVLAR